MTTTTEQRNSTSELPTVDWSSLSDMSVDCSDDSSLSDELMDILFAADGDSTEDSAHGSEISDCTTVLRKRKSRSRYDAPKVFKCDVRWSYGDMLTLVLNGCDPYIAYSFFKTFAIPDLDYSHRRLPSPPENKPLFKGIANLIKGWYITNITAPDATFCATNAVVKNTNGGGSSVTCSFVIRKTDVYDTPAFADVDLAAVNVASDDLGDANEKMLNLWNHSRRKARAASGLKAKYSSLQQQRVRVANYHSDLSDREFNFLDYLEDVSLSLTPLPSVRETHCIRGQMVLGLDENKVIRTFEYVLNALPGLDGRVS